MFVAGNDDIIACYVDISGAGGSTQEENGVESQLKLGAGADEGTSHWLHLGGWGEGEEEGEGAGLVCMYVHCPIYIPYSRYYSQGSIFAGGGALCIARVIRGFKICGLYSPAVFRERILFPPLCFAGLFFADETQL